MKVSRAILAALLLAPLVVRGQDAPLVIRTESRVVLVDVVAADKKGHFVQDLAAKDFRIWEDGREQKISGFSLESSGVSPERPSKHYIAMFFDGASAGAPDQISARQDATRFVQAFATPDRYMAVVDYGFNEGVRIEQNFTTDRDRILKALRAGPPASNAAANPNPTQTVPSSHTRRGGSGAAAPTAQPSGNYAWRDVLASLRGVAVSLGEIRGRKALVFFTGGVLSSPDVTDDLNATIAACNKANVAVYTISSGLPAASGGIMSGASASASSSAQVGRDPRAGIVADFGQDNQNAASELAEGTGGIAFQSTGDLPALLGKVATEQDQYYLLSYAPAADSPEGSCHELRVKVDRGDLDVRARKSYCTTKPSGLSAAKPAGEQLDTRTASGPGNIATTMQLPWFYAQPNVARVKLAMEIAPKEIKFAKEKGKLHAALTFAGVAVKPDGSVAARVNDVVNLDFDSRQQVEAFLKEPYHYENQFEIAPGQYAFRMSVTTGDPGSGTFGKAELPLHIDPWNGKTIGESGLALSRDLQPATDLASGLDESLLEGARPLVVKGTEVIPAGDTRFHASEKAMLYLEAYEPLAVTAKPDAPPLVGVRVRILDPATGKQITDSGVKVVTSFIHPGSATIPILSQLPVSALRPGHYTLEVSVMRQTGLPVHRDAGFDIY